MGEDTIPRFLGNWWLQESLGAGYSGALIEMHCVLVHISQGQYGKPKIFIQAK